MIRFAELFNIEVLPDGQIKVTAKGEMPTIEDEPEDHDHLWVDLGGEGGGA